MARTRAAGAPPNAPNQPSNRATKPKRVNVPSGKKCNLCGRPPRPHPLDPGPVASTCPRTSTDKVWACLLVVARAGEGRRGRFSRGAMRPLHRHWLLWPFRGFGRGQCGPSAPPSCGWPCELAERDLGLWPEAWTGGDSAFLGPRARDSWPLASPIRRVTPLTSRCAPLPCVQTSPCSRRSP